MEDFNLDEYRQIARDLDVPLSWILDWRVIRAWERTQEEGVLEEMVDVYRV